jgi:hypothetical protein
MGVDRRTAWRLRLAVGLLAFVALGSGPAVGAADAALPDGRGYELVSPVDKNGGGVAAPEALFGGGDFQASSSGGAFTYSSASAFAGSLGAPGASQYLSRRGSDSWSTESLIPPLLSGGFDTSPGSGAPYRLFSTDLGRALLSNGKRCRGEAGDCPVTNPALPGSGAPTGYRNYYLRDNSSGAYQALVSAGALSHTPLGPEAFEVELVGSTPDLGHVILSSCAALTSDAAEVAGSEGGCDASAQNLYESDGTGLQALNLKPGDSTVTPGAELAAPAGAVSDDGSRVYWTDGTALYLRKAGGTELIAPAAAFQSASSDGTVVLYTEGGHLYRRQLAGGTTDLTPAGGVQGVLGASADATYVYYLGASGLALWHSGTTTPVAKAAGPGDYPPATGTSRVSLDGRTLVFLSGAPLTGYGSGGLNEVFRYRAPEGATPGSLLCASCSPEGRSPKGAASIPGAVANGKDLRAYKPRVLSADGNRLFFQSPDPLVPTDVNGHRDVYEWEAAGTGTCANAGGCIALVSSGLDSDVATFLDASADGDDVFFLTDGFLVPDDPGAFDVYDARVGGGFPVPQPPIPCIGDACQAIPPEVEDPTPATTVPRAGGNPPLKIANPRRKHRAKHHHHRKKRHKKHGKQNRHRLKEARR